MCKEFMKNMKNWEIVAVALISLAATFIGGLKIGKEAGFQNGCQKAFPNGVKAGWDAARKYEVPDPQ